MSMSVLLACVCTARKYHKRALDPPKLELNTVGVCHMVAGNQTQVLLVEAASVLNSLAIISPFQHCLGKTFNDTWKKIT